MGLGNAIILSHRTSLTSNSFDLQQSVIKIILNY